MKDETLKLPHKFGVRTALLIGGLSILGGVYIFQRTNFSGMLGSFTPNEVFIINRTIRLILNDLGSLFIIFAIFGQAKYIKMAFWLFLIELFIILPGYLVIKLAAEGDSEISSPLLSHVHRLIVNPMLMILLMGGFAYQRFFSRK